VVDELSLLLKAKGILVSRREKEEYVHLIQCHPCHVGRMRLFQTILTNQYAGDVAICCVFVHRIKAECGIDWGWQINYDCNQYKIGFDSSEKGKRLMEMFWSYKKAHLQAKIDFEPAKINQLENVW